ncbi:LptF/LptG family permease [Hippea alviniae]|uniref:LptF/LptG family permease n=1 Tax=Hippea alviniae TaxID=1279027 RepID=UPI0003B7015A|nr:LptF/LptG family permease [Hippea alviniae]
MKKIHKYITKNFLLVFLISLLFSSLLFILSDFFGSLSLILKNDVSLKYIAEYYIFFLPYVVYLSMPLIFGLSALISLGYLSMRNEIIVMRSSGLSIFKIAMPILLLSFLVGLIMFVGKEKLVNYGLQRSSFIRHYYFKNKKSIEWIKVSDYFIKVGDINIQNRSAFDITAYKVKKDFSGVSEILKCSKLTIKRKSIKLHECLRIELPSMTENSIKSKKIDFKGDFYSLLSLSKFKEPSFSYLIKKLKQKKDMDYYLSMVTFRVVYPLSCFILTLLSFVFVLRITPRKSGFIRNVFVGGIVFLVYIGGFEMISSMGKYSMVNPIISIVVFVLFWVAFSLYNLLKLGI